MYDFQGYKKDINHICKELKTNLQTGLNSEEAKSRLKLYGKNKIEQKKIKSIFEVIISQFLSPLMYILAIAAIASILIGEFKDSIVIGIAAITNIIIGTIQEWKAEKSAETLKSYEVEKCNVKRNGKTLKINSEDLVPGDIVIISQGSKVPADIRLSYVADLNIEEAILTGESQAIKKTTEIINQESSIGDRTNIAYSGTYAINGKGEGVVIATGKKTELGKIAKLIMETEEELTPLQKQIKKFSWILGWIMLSITGIIFTIGILRGLPIKQILSISIALAVASVPEGLLVAVTVVLAIGMQRMLKRKALVRHLVAAETLGSVSVICTDKTGTLTKGEMSVEKIYTKIDIKKLLTLATLNNDADISNHERTGSPTEVAILTKAKEHNIDIEKEKLDNPRISEIPFSSKRKFMATLHKINDTKKLIVKGAPEKIFKMCKLSENEIQELEKKSASFTSNGLRLIAIAEKTTNEDGIESKIENLSFSGIIGLQDPLRTEAKNTIQKLTKAGIRTVVVTGDHKETASKIAKGAGLGVTRKVVTGNEIEEMSDDKLYEEIENIDLFARVDPKHKIRIVNAWQRKEKSVAMIGDGVNDAPALKAADIGVALGSGSDVAHEISDMVLLDNNLSTISAAVKQGRIIFENIRKIIVYLMSDSFSEITLIMGSIIFGMPLPILATQILWINVISDGFPHLALTLEKEEGNIMNEAPRQKEEPILNKHMKILIFTIGIITDIVLFGLYIILLKKESNIQHIRTLMFTTLSVATLMYVFSVRTMNSSVFRTNPFSNKWLNIAVIVGLLFQLSAIYIKPLQKLLSTIPLNIWDWVIVLALSSIKIIGIEIAKEIMIKKKLILSN